MSQEMWAASRNWPTCLIPSRSFPYITALLPTLSPHPIGRLSPEPTPTHSPHILPLGQGSLYSAT